MQKFALAHLRFSTTTSEQGMNKMLDTTTSGKKIYVLYGSQTGNSEFIARECCDKLKSDGLPVACLAMNLAKKTVPNMKDVAKLLIIVCSTTGNGDSPENADAWWRGIKLRSAAKDMFLNVPYAVLGLGDTNYDKFCHMGKCIDKRLAELGGKRLLDLRCADEATGLEAVVEPWKIEIASCVKRFLAEEIRQRSFAVAGLVSVPEDSQTASSEEKLSDERAGKGKLESKDNVIEEVCCTGSIGGVDRQEIIPEGLLRLPEVAALLGLTDPLAAQPLPKMLPRVKACRDADTAFSFPPNNAQSSQLSTPPPPSSSSASAQAQARPADGEWTSTQPFHATVAAARWLTSPQNTVIGATEGCLGGSEWGATKRVIYAEFCTEGSGINYTPGDSIGICCPNAPYAVSIVLQRLQLAHPMNIITADTPLVSKDAAAPTPACTLGEILSFKYDLMGTPKKAAVATLAQYCSDPVEAQQMQHLCSKADLGKALWAQFVEAQGVGVAELLALFPSCTPTLPQLLTCLTPLPPRYYSITTTPLNKPHTIGVAFSLVRTVHSVVPPAAAAVSSTPAGIKRSGLCTTYLERILQPWLSNSMVAGLAAGLNQSPVSPVCVRLFHKMSLHFHLPGCVQEPLVFVGPGTGVAPFMGFLEHRALLLAEREDDKAEEECCGMWHGCMEMCEEDLPKEEGPVDTYISSRKPGPVHLYFGCRDEHDYLFKKQLVEYERDRVLTVLEVAMSRLQGAEKVYVTHKIQQRGAELAKLIVEDGAHLYICGDGNRMAKDVHAALVQALVQHAGQSPEGAEATLEDLKLRRRYVLDIWS